MGLKQMVQGGAMTVEEEEAVEWRAMMRGHGYREGESVRVMSYSKKEGTKWGCRGQWDNREIRKEEDRYDGLGKKYEENVMKATLFPFPFSFF
jgi:hypothetical protein